MGLNIKNDEAERLARRLAELTGESVTRAITVAVRERLERVQGSDRAAAAHRAERIRQISRDASARWVEPYRTGAHGDMLYDERGLPH
jgi:antitoxin VapB